MNLFINAVRQFGNFIEPEIIKIKSPDIKDDYLFLLAFSTDSIIVTGDKKLINWANSPVQVISLAAFKEIRID